MADRADVRSLEQLEEFLRRTEAMRGGLLKELEALGLELRRMSHWLSEEVIGYWRDELTKAQRRFAECRDSLSRCLSSVRADEQRPCTDEKKRLRIAEQRLELCQQKLRVSQAALAFWEAERNKQRSYIVRCRDLAESDLRVACEHLRGQIETLHTYANLRSGASSSAAASSSPSAATAAGTPTDVTSGDSSTPASDNTHSNKNLSNPPLSHAPISGDAS